VNKTPQTITFNSIGAQTVGTPLILTAAASSGLTVSYASTTTSVCTVSGATASFVASGSCSITASQSGNTTYAAATPVTESFSVNGTPQTITFNSIGAQTVGTPLILTAMASSGLGISYASTTTSVCTVSGATASFVASGSCSITASQSGSSTYAAATPVTQSFSVNGTPQTITFGSISAQAVGTPLTLTATATSGLAVSYASTTTPICTVANATATFLAPGMCSITASQSGDGISYAATVPVTQSFMVNLAPLPVSNSPVGTALAAQPVQVLFTAAGTLGSVAVLTQGAPNLDFTDAGSDSCTVGTAYTVGQVCTVNVQFTPTAPGQRKGAVVITDGSGNVLANTYIYGTGTGPAIAFTPSPQLLRGDPSNPFDLPSGTAVDGSGNIYVADYGHSGVVEILAADGTLKTLGSGFFQPRDVAVDGAGNVFVADTFNDAVKEILAVNGVIPANPTIIPIGGFVNAPTASR